MSQPATYLANALRSALHGEHAFTLSITFDRIEWHEAWLWQVGIDYLKVTWAFDSEDHELLPLREVRGIRFNWG
jgi:hypothetical protein